MHIGIAGEFRCVVTKADGTVKEDTGFQKNLILNQGLDFFGGGKGSTINSACAIGSGNSVPDITQTSLDAYIAQANGAVTATNYSYVDTGDNMYRMWQQTMYRFTGLNNVNISEVGLVSSGSNSTNYYLTTRALIKDSAGAPTSIGIKTGETLDIYYKIHKVVDTSDKAYVVNVLDGNGGAIPYNVVVRPIKVGSKVWENVSSTIGLSGTWYHGISFSTADLVAKTAVPSPTVTINGGEYGNLNAYTTGSYKRLLPITAGLNHANLAIRVLSLQDSSDAVGIPFLPFQMRFGRVSDDAPLTKTNKDTLSIPLEFSWGRYEGVL